MRNRHMLFRATLLGSALALTALTAAASGTDSKRILAAEGAHSSALPRGTSDASRPASAAYTVLHSFSGGPADGQDFTAEVTLDKSGNIYGDTDGGGTNSEGALFKIAAGTESLLHSFGGSGDGTLPDGAVNIDATGNIYGTTEYGGGSDNGTIWELAAGGTYTLLHSFASNEGNFIRGRMVQDKKGNFYGTGLFGGTTGYGTVFKYATDGTLTVLHTFDSTDGEYPEHGVVRDKSGNFYGVTAFGGTSGEGTVYEIAANGTFSSLYSFTGGTDGGFLYGGLAIDKNGNLYGSTVSGGANSAGTVFKLVPGGTLTTLYNFTGSTDGGGPEGDMLLVGKKLYSAATGGGDQTCSCGGVYEVTLKGKEKLLQAFTAANGDGYSAGVTAHGKDLYGTTAGGGANGYGVVFSMTKK